MLPVIQNLAKKLGCEEGSRSYTGLTLTGLFTSFVPAMSILPANIRTWCSSARRRPWDCPARLRALPSSALPGARPLQGGAHRGGDRPRLPPRRGGVARQPGPAAARWAPDMSPAVGRTRKSGWQSSSPCALLLVHGLDPRHFPAWVGMVGAILCLVPGFGMLDQRKAAKDLSIGSLSTWPRSSASARW
jgi:hypothetical protein